MLLLSRSCNRRLQPHKCVAGLLSLAAHPAHRWHGCCGLAVVASPATFRLPRAFVPVCCPIIGVDRGLRVWAALGDMVTHRDWECGCQRGMEGNAPGGWSALGAKFDRSTHTACRLPTHLTPGRRLLPALCRCNPSSAAALCGNWHSAPQLECAGRCCNRGAHTRRLQVSTRYHACALACISNMHRRQRVEGSSVQAAATL